MEYTVTEERAGYGIHGWGVIETAADGTERTVAVCGLEVDALLIATLLGSKARDGEVGLST